MADTKGTNFTSSITSVTEEEESLTESDTTETCHSNFSSSLMNSSDYNTDDKLTPSLNNICISKGSYKKMRKLSPGGKFVEEDHSPPCNRNNRAQGLQHAFAHPFAVKPPSYVQNVSNKKCQKKNHCETLGKNRQKSREADLHSKIIPQIRNNRNPFTFRYPDYSLYTDFTNNNEAFPHVDSDEVESEEEEDSEAGEGISDSDRFFLPDMNSPFWYTAKVFDRYWLHYNFVMDWFREHAKFVHGQYCQSFNISFYTGCPPQNRKKSSSKERKRKRARKRKATRAKQNQKPDCDEEDAPNECESGMQEEETIEMEITEDMMKFFSQSFKHRLERDRQKESQERLEEETTRIDIEQSLVGQQAPTTTAPSERPGVRRTAEMKLLYGQGAAMIHGMETALQMTFDKFTDRHQPKLWPNMPLKMCFT